MLHVVQSHRIDTLFGHLQRFISDHPPSVFEVQQILVPSYGVGVWVKQRLAQADGICANVIVTFPGAYQWRLYDYVLAGQTDQLTDQRNQNQEQTPLNAVQIRWRLFDYLTDLYGKVQQGEPIPSAVQPLFNLIKAPSAQLSQHEQIADIRRQFWRLSDEAACVLAGYVTYRPKWMQAWSQGKRLDLKAIIKAHQRHHPDYEPPTEAQLERAERVQDWQMALWQAVLADVFLAREQQIEQFWHAIDPQPKANLAVQQARQARLARLPKTLIIFTSNQLPPAELQFYQRLSRYVEILFLHYNPSAEYWADLVDPDWARRNELKKGKLQHYEKAPRLLARLGVQARDIFFQLTTLSGNQYGEWLDDFESTAGMPEPVAAPDTVLGQLQQEILTLEEQPTWICKPDDDSLRVHGCHNLIRQLEVLREELKHWFAQDSSRQPEQVLVLLPELKEAASAIRAVFQMDDGKALRTEQVKLPQDHIPVQITGLAELDAEALWYALRHFTDLLHGRFTAEDLIAWLSLDVVQRAYSLSADQVIRASELLAEAGFRRGFDEMHLRQTLREDDWDIRFTFEHALRRLTLGWVMPLASEQLTVYQGYAPYGPMGPDDARIVAALLRIQQDLRQVAIRSLHAPAQPGQPALPRLEPMAHWVTLLLELLNQHFAQESDTRAWHALHLAIDEVAQFFQQGQTLLQQADPQFAQASESGLPLSFVLDELEQVLEQAPPGSRPTGAVTFSRLGTLRPLPYRLVCLLDLNPQQMPVRDSRSGQDLIATLPYQSGDRSRTADHRGAFLDALLLSEHCWLFYTAFDAHSGKPQPPAIPLQLILDQIKLKLPQPEQAQQLITWHTLQPFEVANFDASQPRLSGNEWLPVAQQLQQSTLKPAPFFSRPTIGKGQSVDEQTTPLPAGRHNLNLISQQLRRPAQTFIREKRLQAPAEREQLATREKLTLDKLDEYVINSGMPLPDPSLSDAEALPYLQQHPSYDLMPVGAALIAYWRRHVAMQQKQQHRVLSIAPEGVTPVQDQMIRWSQERRSWLTVTLPEEILYPQWVQSSFSTFGYDKAVSYWLTHLAWQLARETTAEQAEANDGKTLLVFRNEIWQLDAVTSEQARGHLQDWLTVWQQSVQTPWIFPFKLVGDFLAGLRGKETTKPPTLDWEDPACEQLWQKKVWKHWVEGSSFGGVSPETDSQCRLHPDWQLLLQHVDDEQLLRHYVERDAIRLLNPMLAHLAKVAEPDLPSVQEQTA